MGDVLKGLSVREVMVLGQMSLFLSANQNENKKK